ncbi:MAG: ABC transporter permease [Candidatus Aphodomorpha sp.]
MNIFHRITRQTLLRNRTRTIVTIIGIILSTAMFTAVTTFISSIQHFMLEECIESEGDWYGSVRAAETATLEQIEGDARVSQLATAQVLGYAPLETVEYEEKPYLYVLGADETYFAAMPVHVTEGRLPVNDKELLLPEHLFWRGGVQHAIGDVITVPLHYRQQDGSAVFQRTQYDGSETLLFREERTFTVVGFCEQWHFEGNDNPGYTAFTCAPSTALPGTVTDCYFKLHDAGDTQAFLQELGVSGTGTNRDVLMFMGISGYASFVAVFGGLAAILIVLIMFGSVSLIYNAFSISVSERTKQFGLLISIGATKKQIRSSVVYEALLLSAIGIPLGALSGMLGIGITLRLLSGTAFLAGMRLHASVPAIVAACVIALITVLISVRIPARRAMRVSAIEAIRQSADVQVRAGREPSYKLTYRLFGLPGVLAMKHFRRNRRRYRATIISLFMSIVLFISASSFSRYLTDSVTSVFHASDIDLSVSYQPDAKDGPSPETVYEALSADIGVTAITGIYTQEFATLSVPEASVYPELLEYAISISDGICKLNAMLVVVDDDSFTRCLDAQGLDRSLFFDPEAPRALIGSEFYLIDYGQQKLIHTGTFRSLPDQMNCSLFDNAAYNDAIAESDAPETLVSGEYTYALELCPGAVVDELPFGLNGRESSLRSILVVYPASNAPQGLKTESGRMNYLLQAPEHAAVAERLNASMRELGIRSPYVYDSAQGMENDRSLILVMNVFAYGFITLISLIAVANVFNTISTNIRLRRREFAMLKSVGMTNAGFRSMMNLECLLYGGKALLFGLPVSLLVTWLIYRSISNGFVSAFYVPVVPVIIAVCSVFLVVFVTMLYAMRKIERDNPIDALKNENL